MKKTVAVLVGWTAFVFGLAALSAYAADPVVCSVTAISTLSDGGIVANSTAAPASGTCSWQRGSHVGMQCNVNVYVDSHRVVATYSVLADAGLYYDGGSSGGAATAADELLWFTADPATRWLPLDVQDQHISILSFDGGTGTCKFMTTNRKR